jgi:hypothetical protein
MTTKIDRFNHALSDVPKNPYITRGILQGVENICGLASLIFNDNRKLLRVAGGMCLADKTLKVFHSLDLPKFWWNYHYNGIFRLFVDVAKSFSKLFALPLLLVELGVMPRFLPTPLKIAALGVEILLTTRSFVRTVIKLKPYINGQQQDKINKKNELWKNRRSDFDNRFVEVIDTKSLHKPESLNEFEWKSQVNVYVQQKAQKWDYKDRKIQHSKRTIFLELIYKISYVVMMSFVAVGIVFGAGAVTTIGAGVAGVGVTVFSLYKYFHKKIHPPVQGVRFKPLLQNGR